MAQPGWKQSAVHCGQPDHAPKKSCDKFLLPIKKLPLGKI